jgi:serralysin
VALQATVHDVVLNNVTMKNNYGHGAAGDYWNGDGFATERGVYNVLFENTTASGNSDAGYDLKSSNTVLVNAVSEGNDRNYRLWSDSISLTDCISLNPFHSGGTGTLAHIWMAQNAGATVQNFSFSDSGPARTLFDLSDGGASIALSGTLLGAYVNLINLGNNSSVQVAQPTTDAGDAPVASVTSIMKTGGAGDDLLAGGAGNDTLRGRAGNDTYVVNAVSDQVIERSTEGIDVVQTTLSEYRLTNYVENLIFAGSGDFVGTGNSSSNVMTAGGGNDVLQGGEGSDTLFGGAGTDRLYGGNGNDKIYGGADADCISGQAGNDQIWGDGGDDSLYGEDGTDQLDGGDGADWLDGGGGTDRMVGGLGNDTYVVSVATDRAIEQAGEGIDTVLSAFTYALGENLETLRLTGAKGVNGTGNVLDNVITGNGATNVLRGMAGDDVLDGGAGNDTLTGGDGSDTYLFGRASRRDTIWNADSDGGSDRVLFGAGIAADQLWFARSGTDLTVGILGAYDKATIKNWYSDPAAKLDFELSNGETLAAAQADQLVGAMAAFKGQPAALTSLTTQQQQTIETAIAATWKPADAA